jgi:hypothetical protein
VFYSWHELFINNKLDQIDVFRRLAFDPELVYVTLFSVVVPGFLNSMFKNMTKKQLKDFTPPMGEGQESASTWKFDYTLIMKMATRLHTDFEKTLAMENLPEWMKEFIDHFKTIILPAGFFPYTAFRRAFLIKSMVYTIPTLIRYLTYTVHPNPC